MLVELGPDELAVALRPLFEDAGPLVAYLEGRYFSSWEAVLAATREAISSMDDQERAALLSAHPRIGAPAATLAKRSQLSWAEQGGDRAGAGPVPVRLGELNDLYEQRFGFPFLEWVAGRPLSAIVPVLERRLGRGRTTELTAGCAALVDIATDRLARLRSVPA
jgi:2-oxo-4-hydroxy-4-carboxy--5-ureidoimidazoline (OHCU) decarboxylase